jgi:hypothetical protein
MTYIHTYTYAVGGRVLFRIPIFFSRLFSNEAMFVVFDVNSCLLLLYIYFAALIFTSFV